MCLAIPVRIEEVLDEHNALAEIGGLRKSINISLLDGVQVGDYVILHVGCALQRLNPEEAEHTLALLESLGQLEAARQAALDGQP